MKTILVPTDFSVPAENAARYALRIAKIIGHDLLLCHAIKLSKEAPIAFQASLPLQSHLESKKEAEEQLVFLAESLRADIDVVPGDYLPEVDYTIQMGLVTEVIQDLEQKRKISMLVMGMHGLLSLPRFLLGSKSKEILDIVKTAVLLVPFTLFSNEIKRIAFTSDLCEEDLQLIHSLVDMARCFKAELFIVHIIEDKFVGLEQQEKIDHFFKEKEKIDYDKIYYRDINNSDVDSGLDWLSRYGSVDLFAMVHYRNHLIDRIINRSHTQKLASHINIPLLVFPAHTHPAF